MVYFISQELRKNDLKRILYRTSTTNNVTEKVRIEAKNVLELFNTIYSLIHEDTLTFLGGHLNGREHLKNHEEMDTNIALNTFDWMKNEIKSYYFKELNLSNYSSIIQHVVGRKAIQQYYLEEDLVKKFELLETPEKIIIKKDYTLKNIIEEIGIIVVMDSQKKIKSLNTLELFTYSH